MKKKTMIKNTNIRLDLLKLEDRKAWEYLQTMDRKRYKSYSKAIIIAINDYFSRQEQLEKDPYLETRAKEDAFLERILKTVREGAKEAMPEAALTEFVELLQRTTHLPLSEASVLVLPSRVPPYWFNASSSGLMAIWMDKHGVLLPEPQSLSDLVQGEYSIQV